MRVVLINLGVLLGLALVAEVGLRLAGVRTDAHDVRYENDPMTGPWALPSQQAVVQGTCFRAKVTFNSHGMRDRERTLEKKGKRIALIGDSMVQGAQVEDADNLSRVLERKLGGGIEVLNFGVSSVGTAVELLQYRKRVRPFKPDVVVLVLMSGNDIHDNLPELKRRIDPVMGQISPYILLDASGKLSDQVTPGQHRRTSRLRGALMSLALGQWAYKIYVKVRYRAAAKQHAAINRPAGGAASEGANPQLWERAWKTTEALVVRFRDEVERDKARFVLVHTPADHTSLGKTGELVPLAATASERLARLAAAEKIPFLDLAQYFRQLVKKQGPVEIAFPCDGHWTPRGHREAAEQIGAFLKAQGLL